MERGVNVLAFGLPGTGKTHALCALGHRLVEAGHSVLFAPAYRLVQDLLAAKRDLALPRQLRRLDNFDFLLLNFLLLDDLGYLPQGSRGVRGPLHPDRRTLRAEIAGHNVQPGLLGVGAHLRQPHGHRGHRPGGASLRHPGIQRPQLPHRRGPATPPAGGGEPAKLIDGTGKSSNRCGCQGVPTRGSQRWPVFTMALSMVGDFRIHSVSASCFGLPAASNRW